VFNLKRIVQVFVVGCTLLSSAFSHADLYVPVQVFSLQSLNGVERNIRYWEAKGMVLNTLSSFTYKDGKAAYAGTFETSDEPRHHAMNVSSDTFASLYSDRLNEGYRIKDLSVDTRNGKTYFNGLWEPAKGQAHGFFYGMTESDMASRWNELVKRRGFRVHKHVSYLENGQVRHAVSYLKDDQAFYFYYGMNSAGLQQRANELERLGFYPAKISAMTSNGSPIFSVVFLKPTSPLTWSFGLGTDPRGDFGFDTKYENLKREGYKIDSLASYSGGHFIAAIWIKPPPVRICVKCRVQRGQ
jgi:hypothetical protein